MKLKATIYANREKGPKSMGGHMWVYYYTVRDDTGRRWSSDNACGWRHLFDQAMDDMYVIGRAASLEVLKP